MLNSALKALGKSLVIVTGVAYGVIKAMDVLADEMSDPVQSSSCECSEKHQPAAVPNPAIQRLDGMEQRLIRMEKSIEALTLTPRRAPAEHFVTRAELDRAMQEIGADLDRRFEVQNCSVQSLRSMIARTDELLEQVIENIESTQLTA